MNKLKTLLLSLSMVCTITIAMENDYELLTQTTQEQSSAQTQIQSLLRQKRIADAVYATLVLGTTTATVCNAIWEEPTLNSDYFGSTALSVGNKINTAITVGLGLADIMWLLKPYCAFSTDEPQEDMWSTPMMVTHIFTGSARGVVAGLVGITGGIRRYPHTLAILGTNTLLDFIGVHNAQHHENTDKEIDNLHSKSQ